MKYSMGERQKVLIDMLNQPDAVLSFMFESAQTSVRDTIYRLFGPRTPTLLNASIMDIYTIKQMGDKNYKPSEFVCGGCEPGIPLLIEQEELGWISSHALPYIKRWWETSWCGDEKMLTAAKLRELPNLPWGRVLNERQNQNLLLQDAGRQMEGEIQAAITRMFTDDWLYGKMAIGGPGIPKNTVLDMKRNKKLFGMLPGDGWCNPNASRVETIRAWLNHSYDQSGSQRSMSNIVLVDPIAKKKWFEGVEFQQCDPCGGNRNPNVTRPEFTLNIDGVRNDDLDNLRLINYQDEVFPEVQFWCLDETRWQCVLDDEGNETGEMEEVQVLPAGSMVFAHTSNHAPIGLHGKIQRNNVNAPRVRHTFTYDMSRIDPRSDKIGISSETAPLYFSRRENTVSILFIAPETCPPPKHVCPVIFECDPEGGKKAILAQLESQATIANKIAEAAVKQAKSNDTAAKTVQADKANKKTENK